MVSRSNNTCVDVIYDVLMIADYTQEVKQMQWRGDGSVFDFVADVFSCQGVESMSCSSIGWNLMLRRRSKIIVRCGVRCSSSFNREYFFHHLRTSLYFF